MKERNDMATNNAIAVPTTGHALKAWRERMGFSQRDACEALGCSRGAWSGWENGTQNVPQYIGLATAALALGLKPLGAPEHA
jgi:transcriptional regulator with XRE-family HTH domain